MEKKIIEGRDEGQDGMNVPYKNRIKPRQNTHTTVKPIALMQYLIKLVCPPNGIVLEPFMGSGTTILAAINLGVNYIAYEKEKEYFDIATARIAAYKSQGKLEF